MDSQSQPQEIRNDQQHATAESSQAYADKHNLDANTTTPLHHPQPHAYHTHVPPQFGGSVHDADKHLTAEQNAENLANYNREHAPQLARNHASHEKPHYHTHVAPQYASGRSTPDRALTPEQNAENLAKYNREHADQLAKNKAGHEKHQYHTHTAPQYASGRSTPDRVLTPVQNAENLATYNREHADQLAKNKASHESHLPHYQTHVAPQYASGRSTPDRALTPEQNAESLANYNREHADQLAKNKASHDKHAYHTHTPPKYFSGGAHEADKHLTAEQNAENLAKYNREHADLLAKNLASHGGPSYHDATTVPHKKSRSGAATPERHHSGFHLPQLHAHSGLAKHEEASKQ